MLAQLTQILEVHSQAQTQVPIEEQGGSRQSRHEMDKNSGPQEGLRLSKGQP